MEKSKMGKKQQGTSKVEKKKTKGEWYRRKMRRKAWKDYKKEKEDKWKTFLYAIVWRWVTSGEGKCGKEWEKIEKKRKKDKHKRKRIRLKGKTSRCYRMVAGRRRSKNYTHLYVSFLKFLFFLVPGAWRVFNVHTFQAWLCDVSDGLENGLMEFVLRSNKCIAY